MDKIFEVSFVGGSDIRHDFYVVARSATEAVTKAAAQVSEPQHIVGIRVTETKIRFIP